MSELFGNYRLLERIGGGGLGEVYRAQGPGGPEVALKRLAQPYLGDPGYVANFAAEARISSMLSHECLATALDAGRVDGWPFLALPLALGGSLQDRLVDGPLHPAQLPALASSLGRGLEAIHNAGFTHSDLSPANLLYKDEQPLLADFGAATAIGSAQPTPLGTFSYMCPEQVRSQPLDARSDIFLSLIHI
mgnify:CR=1 FL=1